MSAPPPSLRQFTNCFIHEIQSAQSELCDRLRNLPAFSERINSEIRHIFSSWRDRLDSENFSQLHEKNIRSLTALSMSNTEKISQIIYSNGLYLHDEEGVLAKQINVFKEYVGAFVQLLLHIDGIQNNTLESYLDRPWAQTEFISLIHGKDEWAEAKLQELLANDNLFARDVLFYHVQNVHLIIANKDERWLQEKITHLLMQKKSNPAQEHACRLILTLLQYTDCEWCRNVVKLAMSIGEGDAIISVVVKLWDSVGPPRLEWLQQYLIEGLVEKQDWAVLASYTVLHSVQESHLSSFIQELLRICQTDVLHLKQTMLCIGALLLKTNSFYLKLDWAIRLGKFVMSPYSTKIAMQQCLQRLRVYKNFFNFHQMQNFLWRAQTVIFKYRILSMLLQREMCLIDVLNGQDFPQASFSPATSDHFPQVEYLLIGAHTAKQSSTMDPHWESLLKQLDEHQIQVICCNNDSRQLRSSSKNIKIISKGNPSIWVRDSCISHHCGIRFPHIPKILDKAWLWNEIISKRFSRFEKHYPGIRVEQDYIGVLGRVSTNLDQLRTAECFFEGLCQMDSFHSLYFTFQEGGNTMLGTSEGKPFAIIGKDTLEVNSYLLQQELVELNYRKIAVGKWKKEDDPVVRSDLPNLDEEDLRFFFSLDLGIPKENIYFVENCQYHLDMSIAILNEKTVVVNDSEKALEIWKEYASIKMQASGFKHDKDVYAQRLESLEKQSAFLKKIEDITASQLTQHGFNVIRQGGVFEDLLEDVPNNHRVNFFNFLTLTTRGGARLVIGMDSDAFFRSHFENMILNHIPHVDKIYYLNSETSRKLLSKSGGVHCTIRPIEIST